MGIGMGLALILFIADGVLSYVLASLGTSIMRALKKNPL